MSTQCQKIRDTTLILKGRKKIIITKTKRKWFGRMPITLKIQFRSIASYSNLPLVSLSFLYSFPFIRDFTGFCFVGTASFFLRHCCRRRHRRSNFDDREWYDTFALLVLKQYVQLLFFFVGVRLLVRFCPLFVVHES